MPNVMQLRSGRASINTQSDLMQVDLMPGPHYFWTLLKVRVWPEDLIPGFRYHLLSEGFG